MDDKHKQLPDLFDKSFRDIVKAFDSFFDESIKHVHDFFQQSTIPVEVFETERDVTIEAYLPNVSRDRIRIDRSGSQLRIRVDEQKIREVIDEDSAYLNRTHAFSQKERIVTLPFEVADAASRASFKNHVLTIVFPKQNSTIKVIDVDAE